MGRRQTFTDRRRALLARRVETLEMAEPRSMISESFGALSLVIGVPAVAAFVAKRAEAQVSATSPQSKPKPHRANLFESRIVSHKPGAEAGGTRGNESQPLGSDKASQAADKDWLSLKQKATRNTAGASRTPLPPPKNPASSGGALPSGGGGSAGNPAQRSISPLKLPSSSSPSSAGGGGSVPAVAATVPAPSQRTAPVATPPITSPQPATSAVEPVATTTAAPQVAATSSVGPTTGSFPYFPLYTLDENAGSVIFPGFNQLATPGGNVDLRAQVSGTTVSTYSWTTSGLTDAVSSSITGASTYDLKFQWNTSFATSRTDTATLTVTNSSGQQESRTYTFQVFPGSGTAGTGTATWPQTLSPDTVSGAAPAFASDNVSVGTNSGSLDTSITLPTFNSNVPALGLTYDSLTADPRPIIVAPHTLDPTLAIPSQVSGQLTFNGTAGTTYYYNTSQFIPGDVQQIALQANATSLSTGRYGYTVTLGDIRSTTTTTTLTGTATVLNASSSAFGDGWTLAGLEKIDSASGGVILELGGGGKSLWFTGSFSSGGTYTNPAGEFSTLVQNSNGSYTRTLTDGTQITFNSSGYETATIDRNGLHTSYAYDSSNRLQTVTDPYGEVTTFAYSGGLLQTITDPAGRIATFTHSGNNLTGVTYPDASTWTYGYDSSGRLTSVTEPSSTGEPNPKTVTIAYDSAERVSTITRPDSTTEKIASYQEQGWTNSGTSSSPAAATLLAASVASYTDPLGNISNIRPDWSGLGLPNVTTDPLGNVASSNRDGNGLATITIDRLNRVTQNAYDSKGNVTKTVYPDLTYQTATYNSFAEVLVNTDPRGKVTTNTYDTHGNLTNVIDPSNNTNTMTYTANGRLSTATNLQPNIPTPPGPLPPGGTVEVQYFYDSKDRLTTLIDQLGDTTTYSYDTAGRITSQTDPDGHTTTYSYDLMNRRTGVTTAAGTSLAATTITGYDAAGLPVTVTDPLSHTTTNAYDIMDRVTTVTDADGDVTKYAYDSDGRQTVVTDPNGNRTTFAYDADGRTTTITSPSVNAPTTGVTATFSYDAEGQLVDTTDADGRRTTYSYDLRGRQTGEAWVGSSPSEIVTSTYDADSNLTGISDHNATLTFTYDAQNRLVTATTAGPSGGQPLLTLTYSYDPNGDITSITDSLSGSGGAGVGLTTYVYDNAYRLTTITQSFGGTSGPQAIYGYDAASLETSLTRTIGGSGTAVSETLSYDSGGRLTTQAYSGGTTYKYSYDLANRLTSETDQEGLVSFTYDSTNQLTGASGTRAETYTYDSGGNRTMTGYTTGTGNELTTSPGYTYTYDNAGNLISQTNTSTSVVTTYTYDYHNQLTGVKTGGTVLATYTYDALGHRIGVDDSGTQTWTVYNGRNAAAHPYADFNSSGTVQERYLFRPGAVSGATVDEILARTSSGGTSAWYLTDKLGTVRDIDNTSAAVIDHVVYDSYGNVVTQTNAINGDRFKYTGMQSDSTVGLYYDNARWYSQVTGRFISQDPKGFSAGDLNLYRYVDNTPTNSIDPSGLDLEGAIYGGLAGAFTGGVVGTFVGFGSGALPGAILGFVGGFYNGWLKPPGTTKESVNEGAVIGVIGGIIGGGGARLAPVIKQIFKPKILPTNPWPVGGTVGTGGMGGALVPPILPGLPFSSPQPAPTPSSPPANPEGGFWGTMSGAVDAARGGLESVGIPKSRDLF